MTPLTTHPRGVEFTAQIFPILQFGLSVVPIPARQKRPSFEGWQDAGQTTSDGIDDNYGVLCDGITVVDFDPRNMQSEDTDHEIEFICDMYGLDSTFAVKTGGGGLHLYYRGESPAGKLLPGVDIKSGHGHQVVGPGSVHPNGTEYRILVQIPLQDIPSSVSDRSGGVTGAGTSKSDTEAHAADLREFGSGERNDMLFRHLARMRSMGLENAEIELYAQVANRTHVTPPLASDELEIIVAQVLKYEVGRVLEGGLDLFDVAAELKPKRVEIPRFATLQDLAAMPVPEFLVDRLIPASGVGQMFGPSYSGKTFVALDLALSLAFGEQSWMGNTITPAAANVLYVAMEGGFDISERAQAWAAGHDKPLEAAVRFMVEQPFNIMNNEDMKTLVSDLGAAEFPPAMVVIDTQSLAAPMLDENDNSNMTELMSRVKLLSTTLGCFVLLVHHTGHGAAGRARGASSQFANMDVSLQVLPASAREPNRIKITKLKFGRLPGGYINFELASATSGEDESVYAKRIDRARANELTAANLQLTVDTVAATDFLSRQEGQTSSIKALREALGIGSENGGDKRRWRLLRDSMLREGLIEKRNNNVFQL